MQGMFRSNCSVQVGNCKFQQFLKVSLHLAPPKPLTGQFQHRLKQQPALSVTPCKPAMKGTSKRRFLQKSREYVLLFSLQIRKEPPKIDMPVFLFSWLVLKDQMDTSYFFWEPKWTPRKGYSSPCESESRLVLRAWGDAEVRSGQPLFVNLGRAWGV